MRRANCTVAAALLLVGLAAHAAPAEYANPVIPGDAPDPSVVRVQGVYWAAATTSEWLPAFQVLRSTDLVNWQPAGAIFREPPAWTKGSYWAPELGHDGRRFTVHYTARNHKEGLCVAFATAPKATGPWTDHGPLVCEDAGSIDGFPVRDEKGVAYLIWKYDGNSLKAPTPLSAQQLSPDGTRLVGEKTELIHNDVPWEGELVEGPFVMRRGPYFYMFYSANGCCGVRCIYALGVARSKALLGPWEKNPANPILSSNEDWRCPGHGGVVKGPGGRDFLLYHAYAAKGFERVGRQGLLDELKWGEDGWPSINGGRGPSTRAATPFGKPRVARAFRDSFTKRALAPDWQWPQARPARAQQRAGSLTLESVGSQDTRLAAVLGVPIPSDRFVATTSVRIGSSPSTSAPGLALYGDSENAIGVSVVAGKAILWRRDKKRDSVLSETPVASAATPRLRVQGLGEGRFRFEQSADGKTWTELPSGTVEGRALTPWDLSIRAALLAGPGGAATFDDFALEALPPAADLPR